MRDGDIECSPLHTVQIRVKKTLNDANGEECKGVEKQGIRISQLQRDGRQLTVDE
jgi:hypothetical protein